MISLYSWSKPTQTPFQLTSSILYTLDLMDLLYWKPVLLEREVGHAGEEEEEEEFYLTREI